MSEAQTKLVVFGGSCWTTFVTWFFGGLGATLGYLLMNWIWKKIGG